MSSDKMPGIVCFEGAWSEALDSRESIEPALRCLESFGLADVIHKDVGTKADLRHYVDKWLGKKGRAMPEYALGIFAFHGDRYGLVVGEDDIDLAGLAEILDGRATGRVIYLGGCEVLARPGKELKEFCQVTGAKGLVGYTKSVPYIETIAFEVLLIEATLLGSSFKPVYNKLVREHPEWTRRLGLRMAHKSWASDRLTG